MLKPPKKLTITARLCETKPAERAKTYDTKCPGFLVSRTPRGVATFYFKYWDNALGKQVQVRIGDYDPVHLTVEQARANAYDLKGRAGAGEDIAQSARRAKAQQTKLSGKKVEEIIDEYTAWMKVEVKKADGEMRPRIESWSGSAGFLNRFVRPVLGKMVASEVENDHIADLQNKIVAGEVNRKYRPSLSNARNTRGAASAMFGWAAEAGRRYVEANPCVDLPSLDKEVERERVLTPEEIKTLWFGLDRPDLPYPRQIALALKLELVTMLRTQEFLAGSPKEVTGLGTRDAQFRIPLKRVKKRRVIVHPLNDLAQEILAELIEDSNQPRIFMASADGDPFDGGALHQAVRGRYTKGRATLVKQGICDFLGMAHWTPHDLRRTAATIAGENFEEHEIAKCLDHRKDKGEQAAPRVTGIYVRSGISNRRSGYFEKKREILDFVAAVLRDIIGLPPAPAMPGRLTLVA